MRDGGDAAIGEAAATEVQRERRHGTGNRGERNVALAGLGQRVEQLDRVRMQRPREEVFRIGHLDDLSRVHQRDAMRHLRDDREVVRDQHHRHAEPLLQVAQQVEDLRLDRDVERGRRLVGDQHLRLGRERDGDHHALLLATRHLERIVVDAPLGLRDADLGQPLDRPRPRGRAAQRGVRDDRLDDLLADPQHGGSGWSMDPGR